MSLDREVGGLTCHQVLARLSDYLDDDLEVSVREQLMVHLRGCQECLRFGGSIGQMVRAVRGRLEVEVPRDVAERLARQLAAEPGPDRGG